MQYTVEVHKQDRRVKGGLRFVDKIDVEATGTGEAERKAQHTMWEENGKFKSGYIYTVYETFVTRRNAMTGEEFVERYDTPYHCSPSSESYWSM